MMSRKLTPLMVLALMIAGTVTSCAKRPPTPEIIVETVVLTPTPVPEPTTPTGPVMGGTVSIGQEQEPDKLVAQWSPLSVSYEVSALVNEFLLRYNPESEIVPNLATEVPTEENGGVSADGKTYTFKLRDDVTWHDGEPFPLKDVAFTIEVAADQDR